MDTKCAQFHANSMNTDDKLVSCYELNCCNIHLRPQSTSASASSHVKHVHPPPPREYYISHDYNDYCSVIMDDTGITEIAPGVGELSQKCKGKGKAVGTIVIDQNTGADA